MTEQTFETHPRTQEEDPTPVCTGTSMRSFLHRHSNDALRAIEKASIYAGYPNFDSVKNPEGENI